MPDLVKKRAFQLLLAGQCISNTGEACRLIAVTMFLVKATGSGVSAAFGLICAAIPGILLSPFAGAIGDMLPEKQLLAAADYLRAVVIILFTGCSDFSSIYLLLVILSIIDTVCGPARRKFVTAITGKSELLSANSMLTGASGAAFLIGPLLGGVMVEKYGTEAPFIFNSLTYVVSGSLILSIRYVRLAGGTVSGRNNRKNTIGQARGKGNTGIAGIYSCMLEGFGYFKGQKQIKVIVSVCALLSFGMVSMNMAFYPFAFDVLGLTARGWSLMLSIFYGTNLAAMAITPLISKMKAGKAYASVFLCMIATGAIWSFYAFTNSLPAVFLLQFLEGTILAVCGIILGTLLQTLAANAFIARVSGMNDLVGSISRLAAMLFAFIMLKYGSFRHVFIVDAVLMISLSLFSLMNTRRHQ